MSTLLREFIAHAQSKNVDLPTIRMLLLSAGWKEKEVAAALVDQVLDQPVPTPPDVGGAREGFLHLLSFACLFATLGSAVALFFQYLNRALPDATDSSYYYNSDSSLDGIRWGLAILVVTFPIFWGVTRLLVREIRAVPERARSPIRRWLTYLTLLVTALTIVGDLSTLIYYFLDGEISLRFLLKVFVLFGLAGTTFVYYLLALRFPEPVPVFLGKPLTVWMQRKALALFVLAVVWGALVIGTPQNQRAKRFDTLRIQHLQQIGDELIRYAYDGKPRTDGSRPTRAVPDSLSTLAAAAQYQKLTLQDPATGVPYVYRVLSATKAEVCADFQAELDQSYNVFWNHPAGAHCFTIDVERPTQY